jgi:hypothetical protein
VVVALTPFFPAGAPKTGTKYMTFAGCLQFPFSTGSIHITSTDATVQPAIDGGYFSDDFGKCSSGLQYTTSFSSFLDLEVLVPTMKFLRKIANTGGFQGLVVFCRPL